MEKQRRRRGGVAGAGGGEGGREGEGGEIVIHRPLQRGTETDVNNSSKSWSNIHRSVGCVYQVSLGSFRLSQHFNCPPPEYSPTLSLTCICWK